MLLLPNQQHQHQSFDINESDVSSLIINAINKSSNHPTTLIFWSSRDPKTGQMWCPDCVKMEASLVEVLPTLSADSTANLIYVYVGERDEWKLDSNVFRKSPWNVGRIPTVLKLACNPDLSLEERISSQGTRLVESEALDPDQLSAFLAR